MKFGTIIELPDGRIGTICWNNLDGYGGVWEAQKLSFSDAPKPEFMLRESDYEENARRYFDNEELECVGTDYVIIKEPL